MHYGKSLDVIKGEVSEGSSLLQKCHVGQYVLIRLKVYIKKACAHTQKITLGESAHRHEMTSTGNFKRHILN